MKKMMLLSAGLFALVTLVICASSVLFVPSDGLGVPNQAWLRTLSKPAVWVGVHVWQRFHCPIWMCQVAGIAAMTFLWALIGSIVGLAYGKFRRQRSPA
jgi:hypothetical protein